MAWHAMAWQKRRKNRAIEYSTQRGPVPVTVVLTGVACHVPRTSLDLRSAPGCPEGHGHIVRSWSRRKRKFLMMLEGP